MSGGVRPFRKSLERRRPDCVIALSARPDFCAMSSRKIAVRISGALSDVRSLSAIWSVHRLCIGCAPCF